MDASNHDQFNAITSPDIRLSNGTCIRWMIDLSQTPPKIEVILIINDFSGKMKVYKAFDEIKEFRKKLFSLSSGELQSYFENLPNAQIIPIGISENNIRVGAIQDQIDYVWAFNVYLVIEEKTKKQNVYDIWESIKVLKFERAKLVGTDLNKNDDHYVSYFNLLNERGVGYGEIAKIMNYYCLAYVIISYENGETFNGEWKYGIPMLLFIFEGWNLTELDLGDWLEYAYESLDENVIPWTLETGPINRSKVRECIDYFRFRLRSEQLIPNNDNSFEEAYLVSQLPLLRRGHYDKVNRLLKLDPDYWKKISSWISKYRKRLIKDLSNSTSQFIDKDAREWLRMNS